MNIVLEGPDGGGKSTLAAILNSLTGMPIIAGEGPPKGPGEINERARRYLKHDGVIFDRHPCVSQPVYGIIRRKDNEAIEPDILLAFYEQNHLLVHVKHTSLSLQQMTVGPNEDSDHIAAVRARYADICFSYDRWAMSCAHFIMRRDMPHFEHYTRLLAAAARGCLHHEANLRARASGQQIPRVGSGGGGAGITWPVAGGGGGYSTEVSG